MQLGSNMLEMPHVSFRISDYDPTPFTSLDPTLTCLSLNESTYSISLIDDHSLMSLHESILSSFKSH